VIEVLAAPGKMLAEAVAAATALIARAQTRTPMSLKIRMKALLLLIVVDRRVPIAPAGATAVCSPVVT
jgi:hypothetical protein